jgi:hypothetical protein
MRVVPTIAYFVTNKITVHVLGKATNETITTKFIHISSSNISLFLFLFYYKLNWKVRNIIQASVEFVVQSNATYVVFHEDGHICERYFSM